MMTITLIKAAISSIALFLCLWGSAAFFPRRIEREDNGPAWLTLGIFVGMASSGLGLIYANIVEPLALSYGPWTYDQVAFFSKYFVDTLWQVGISIGVYLHFFARWRYLTPNEREFWRPLAMLAYPDRTHWAVRYLLWKRNKDQS